MDRTAELRWFFTGPPPPEARAWFDALDGLRRPPGARTDTYLRPTDPALGVKLREGRLELKRREGEGTLVTPAPRVQGRAETWVKWGFVLNGGSDRAAGGDWIEVAKERWMCSFAVEPDRVRPADGRPAPGYCNAELTAIGVEGERWWTVCLEAHTNGDPAAGAPGPILARAAAHVFACGTPPPLTDEASYSYPDWLLAHLAPR